MKWREIRYYAVVAGVLAGAPIIYCRRRCRHLWRIWRLRRAQMLPVFPIVLSGGLVTPEMLFPAVSAVGVASLLAGSAGAWCVRGNASLRASTLCHLPVVFVSGCAASWGAGLSGAAVVTLILALFAYLVLTCIRAGSLGTSLMWFAWSCVYGLICLVGMAGNVHWSGIAVPAFVQALYLSFGVVAFTSADSRVR